MFHRDHRAKLGPSSKISNCYNWVHALICALEQMCGSQDENTPALTPDVDLITGEENRRRRRRIQIMRHTIMYY